jgi:hypothetical protein
VRDIAAKIARGPQLSIRFIKRAVYQGAVSVRPAPFSEREARHPLPMLTFIKFFAVPARRKGRAIGPAIVRAGAS